MPFTYTMIRFYCFMIREINSKHKKHKLCINLANKWAISCFFRGK